MKLNQYLIIMGLSLTCIMPLTSFAQQPNFVDLKAKFIDLQVAARLGHAASQNELATKYALGEGTKQDYKKAFEWYVKAGSKGLAIAQRNVGVMYEQGWGTEKNLQQALIWYQKAAQQNLSSAKDDVVRLSAKQVVATPTTQPGYIVPAHTVQQTIPQSIEVYRKQTFTERMTITEYIFQNQSNQLYIKADDADYQNSVIEFNGKQYSLKQIYAPYYQDPHDDYSKYFANDVSRIAQVFLLNNDELVIILSASPRNFGMYFYQPFGLSLISIKNGIASVKGNLEGLTYNAQAFVISPQGLELVQFGPARDTDGKNEVEYDERLSAIYQNGKLSSKIVPYTKTYEKQVKPIICKMYLAHTYHESLYDHESGYDVFNWANVPSSTEQEEATLKTGGVQALAILEKKYCK
ncbi:tetratricopeptide repeat protein [Acinetobacter populi]|uniref:Sel1 repeat family protein n=1 Tax=Acinetobacter populi TaxID=1582270 RepID=A0A1Z9Z0V9_9GAMM|nr:tetratricopeptide repeat protein [Acinetobacter populi]OUY08067.1 hypothetical protein CAP51_00120 [Acinetobacter populi]